MDKTVLVTGASGFIGRYFCFAATEAGCTVFGLTRNKAKAALRLPKSVKLISSLDELSQDIKVDIVLNLAGEPLAAKRWNKRAKKVFYESRVGLTQKLFVYFKFSQAPPKLLISGSAIGYYGPHGDQPLDEAGLSINSFSHKLCSDWEHVALQFNTLGARVCILRTGIVLGKDEGALKRMQLPFRLGLGGALGDGKQWMSWIHIDDMIGLIFHLIKRTDLRGGINATAPAPVKNKQFSQLLAETLRRPAFLPMPAVLAKLLFGEMAQELLLVGQKVIPRKALETGFQFQYPALKEALQQIYSP